MLAKPPLWLACPPLLAMSCTSSLGRFAKLPGLLLSAIVLLVFGLVDRDLVDDLNFLFLKLRLLFDGRTRVNSEVFVDLLVEVISGSHRIFT